MILVNRLDPLQHFLRQLQVETGNVAVQLLQCGRANDVAGHERLLRDECQGHLRRVQAVLAGQGHVAAARCFRLRVEIAAEAAVGGSGDLSAGGRHLRTRSDRKPNASGE